MKNINLWDSSLKEQYIFFYNIKDYITYLLENSKTMKFSLKNKYSVGTPSEDSLEYMAQQNELDITYTDQEHPISISKSSNYSSHVNPDFFQNNKNEFISEAKNLLYKNINNEYSSIQIQDFIFSDELLDMIINTDNLKYKTINYYLIEGIDLTEEQIKKIKDNHLEFNIIGKENKKISSKYLIENYTMQHLKQLEKIKIDIPLKNGDLNNLIFLNDDSTIILEDKCTEEFGEKEYLNQVINIINILKTHNKKYNIEIKINNREILRQSKLIETLPSHFNLFIVNDYNIYKLEEYLNEEEQLENLIKPIRESSLSPLERYLAVYNVVKKYKKYKENMENPNEARYIKNILKNEYIVCVGFSRLLNDLLNRVNIPSKEISVQVDTSYDKGYTQEEIPVVKEGHARCLVKINDEKYNINGIYVCDPTWDNNLDVDLYLNSLLTFDRKKEATRLEFLSKEDLLLDFHNYEEFNTKLNYFINRVLRKNGSSNEQNKETIKTIYLVLYSEIMEILFDLDINLYKQFYQKYRVLLQNKNDSLEKLEPIFNNMINEYAEYIIPLVNNNVELSTILEAAKEVKKNIDKLNEQQLNEWYEKTKEINFQESLYSFPYKYDSSLNKEAYLESDNKPRKL